MHYSVTEYTDANGYVDLGRGLTLQTAIPFMQEHSVNNRCDTLLTDDSTGNIVISCTPNGSFGVPVDPPADFLAG